MATIEFKLPDIGEGVAEGEITSWKVVAGEAVTEDQIMVEVMTDKATVEIGSPVTGNIVEIRAAEGDTVPVGDVLVVLSSEHDAPVQQLHGHGGGSSAATAPASNASAGSASAAATAAPSPASAAKAPAASVPASGTGQLEEVDFKLPDIGEGVAEGEITKWLVGEGDPVTEDQPMLEVMTDKATVEIGSPVDGEVLSLLHPEGTTVPVGEVLLVLGTRSGAPSIRSHGGHTPAAKPAPAPAATPAAASTPAAAPGTGGDAGAALASAPRASTLSDTGLPSRADGTRRVRAAPAVRRLARELSVDISGLEGSGKHGRVTMADVRAATHTAAPGAAPAPASTRATAPAAAATPAFVQAPRPAPIQGDERVPLRGLRKRIAKQMRVAKQTAAHFAYIEEIDVTELVTLRTSLKAAAAAKGAKLTYMPFIIKAMCAALRQFPIMNASLDEQASELVYHGAINMGIAVDSDNGLIVPVIRDADSKSMLTLSTEMLELADRARAGKTRPDDVGGGTFTITNAGNIGGLLATPIINVPEVAILGVHAIRRKPWVVNDEIVIRDIMYLSLSLDHRVVDGAVGARAMNVVKQLLENPALMLLEA